MVQKTQKTKRREIPEKVGLTWNQAEETENKRKWHKLVNG